MPRKETVGTGITARERTLFDTNDRADMDAWLASFDAFGDKIAAKGIWGAVTDQIRTACEGILQSQPDRGHEPDSPRDFARQIVRHLEIADHAILEGKAEVAARFALEAGQLWATAVMKWSWEELATRGEKNKRGTDLGGAMRKGKVAADTPARLAEMHRLVADGKSISRAAQICAAKGLGNTAESNRRLWHDHRKKTVRHL